MNLVEEFNQMSPDSADVEEKQSDSFDGEVTTRTNNMRLRIDTKAGVHKPSPDFLKRRHERMRDRMSHSNSKEEDSKTEEKEEVEEESRPKTPQGAISSASPTAIRSFRQLRAKRKTRVPGGAAAKLIGKATEEETGASGESTDGDEPVEVAPPTDEFIKMRDEAKTAFSVGTQDNRRYHSPSKRGQPASEDEVGRSFSIQEVPSVLTRSEVFHENATAAVMSLLTQPEPVASPRSPNSMRYENVPSITSSHSRDFSQNTDFSKRSAMNVSPRNAFQAPARNLAGGYKPMDIVSNSSGIVNQGSFHGIGELEDSEETSKGKNPLEQPLLSEKAVRRLAQMKEQMKDPNATLSELISNIATPDDHKPGTEFSRGFMVRRKNACGALQVLTAKTVHRVQICWTVGVLSALGSVLEDSGDDDLSIIIPDAHTRREFIDARKRAVSALMNLSVPTENRLAVFHTPRMMSNLIRVINLDEDESRKGCCAILAQLAKTKENRLLMVQIPGLIDAITGVIEPYYDDDHHHGHHTFSQDSRSYYDDDESSRTPLRSSSTDGASTADLDNVYSSFASSQDEAKLDMDTTRTMDESLATQDPVMMARRYDDEPNEHLHGARSNVFALCTHLVKEKDNTYILSRHRYFMETLIAISQMQNSPSHEHAVKLLAHLTRHRGNSKHLLFKIRSLVPALVKASLSQNDESRKYACFALQNLSQDKPCRQELAVTDQLLTVLCVRARQASDPEERLAAIHALKNLTDEPANLIPMTNSPECFATLMQIAHGSDDSLTEMMQYLACDALATLSHWFRSIATSGQRIEVMKSGGTPSKELFVPSLQIATYEQWQ